MRYMAAGRASCDGFSCQLLFVEGRICKKCTSSRRIKRGSRPLQLENRTAMAERKPEQAGKYDGKMGGTALPDINAGENEIEKNAAWAGQARVCRGKHERDSPYPLHA